MMNIKEAKRLIRCRGWRKTYRVRKGGKVYEKQTRLYSIWLGMRARIRNPKHHAFKWYGGKGLSVYEPWHDYSTFRIWAISSGYRKGLSIDRIDSDVGYCPENCEWVSLSENTRRRVKKYPVHGSNNKRSIVNESDVVEIRKMFESGIIQKEIARLFGLSIPAVSAICTRRTWRHVP